MKLPIIIIIIINLFSNAGLEIYMLYTKYTIQYIGRSDEH